MSETPVPPTAPPPHSTILSTPSLVFDHAAIDLRQPMEIYHPHLDYSLPRKTREALARQAQTQEARRERMMKAIVPPLFWFVLFGGLAGIGIFLLVQGCNVHAGPLGCVGYSEISGYVTALPIQPMSCCVRGKCSTCFRGTIEIRQTANATSKYICRIDANGYEGMSYSEASKLLNRFEIGQHMNALLPNTNTMNTPCISIGDGESGFAKAIAVLCFSSFPFLFFVGTLYFSCGVWLYDWT